MAHLLLDTPHHGARPRVIYKVQKHESLFGMLLQQMQSHRGIYPEAQKKPCHCHRRFCAYHKQHRLQ